MGQLTFYSLFLFSLLVSQIFKISQSFPDFCHPYDKKILLNIKYKLGNPPSLASWDPNTDCANWKDVQCGNIEGHVTSISIIDALDVHSPIPPYFDRLYWLTNLNFINVPNLSGPIPSYFGTLTNLTAFIVSGTKLTGSIPRFLNRLTKLNQLDLSSNKLTGPIPNFLGQIKSLSYLVLSSNGLTGPVLITLTQLLNLSYLQLKIKQIIRPDTRVSKKT
ncbi:hypothetical protein RND81_09G164700 [Saponaria officinalis]|uniref:Leucine-rich repeat-containing N-terminal plant-type domain-containing protein n=1 Tax=Saponaria officinalis TaxID=3572 RepID=A0AAW1INJ8_SAPOF